MDCEFTECGPMDMLMMNTSGNRFMNEFIEEEEKIQEERESFMDAEFEQKANHYEANVFFSNDDIGQEYIKLGERLQDQIERDIIIRRDEEQKMIQQNLIKNDCIATLNHLDKAQTTAQSLATKIEQIEMLLLQQQFGFETVRESKPRKCKMQKTH